MTRTTRSGCLRRRHLRRPVGNRSRSQIRLGPTPPPPSPTAAVLTAAAAGAAALQVVQARDRPRQSRCSGTPCPLLTDSHRHCLRSCLARSELTPPAPAPRAHPAAPRRGAGTRQGRKSAPGRRGKVCRPLGRQCAGGRLGPSRQLRRRQGTGHLRRWGGQAWAGLVAGRAERRV